MCITFRVKKEMVLILFCSLLTCVESFVVVGEYLGSKGFKQNVTSLDQIHHRDKISSLRIVHQDDVQFLRPGFVSNFSRLSRFALEGNINGIYPGTFVNIPRVQEIRIYYASIVKLRAGTFADLNVQKLLLQFNQLTYLDEDAFLNLPELQTIDLQQNQLVVWEELAFHNTSNVRELLLRRNLLRNLPDNAFDAFPKLEFLDLDTNELKSVGRFLYKLPRIRTLYLSHNRLLTLPADFFAPRFDFPTSELQLYYQRTYDKIDLSDNRLSYMSEKVLHDLSRTDELLIGWNPWHCSCYNKFITWSETHHVKLDEKNGASNAPLCISPSKTNTDCAIIKDMQAIHHYVQNVPFSSSVENFMRENPEPLFPVEGE